MGNYATKNTIGWLIEEIKSRFASKTHSHTLSDVSDVTASVDEVNYLSGVTSSVQTQLDGKAASSHNHSASDITSGTLPVTRGGTGRTTTANGAMYATSAGGALTMGALPIAQGGTGKTTAADARSALGAAAKSWTSIGSVKSDASKLNISGKLDGYSEVMVIVGYSTTYWSSCVIRVGSITSSLKEWYTGGGTDYASSWKAGSGFYLSTTQFGAMYVYLNSSTAKTATAYLYAR